MMQRKMMEDISRSLADAAALMGSDSAQKKWADHDAMQARGNAELQKEMIRSRMEAAKMMQLQSKEASAYTRHTENLEEKKRHHMAMEGMQREKAERASAAPRKAQGLNAKDQSTLQKLYDSQNKLSHMRDQAQELIALSGKLPSGGMLAKAFDESPNLLATLGQGNKADLERFMKGTGELAGMATREIFGARGGVGAFRQVQNIKPNLSMEKESREAMLAQYAKTAESQLDHINKQIDALEARERGEEPAYAHHRQHKGSSSPRDEAEGTEDDDDLTPEEEEEYRALKARLGQKG